MKSKGQSVSIQLMLSLMLVLAACAPAATQAPPKVAPEKIIIGNAIAL